MNATAPLVGPWDPWAPNPPVGGGLTFFFQQEVDVLPIAVYKMGFKKLLFGGWDPPGDLHIKFCADARF